MPTLIVKNQFIQKLKQLGIYDKWMDAVKADTIVRGSIKLQEPGWELPIADWSTFIARSFNWVATEDGFDFWDSISGRKYHIDFKHICQK